MIFSRFNPEKLYKRYETLFFEISWSHRSEKFPINVLLQRFVWKKK